MGFYQVNERLGDSELVPTARRLGEWVHARGGAAGTVGVVLNSAKMEEFYGGKVRQRHAAIRCSRMVTATFVLAAMRSTEDRPEDD